MFNVEESKTKSGIRLLSHQWWIPTLMALVLVPVASANMLLFHTLIELFAVSVAINSFIVAWNTFNLARNQFLLILGCGYLSISFLDLAHTLTFTGMPFFPQLTSNTTIQFWIVARFYEAFLVLLAPLFASRLQTPLKTLSIHMALCLLGFGIVVFNITPSMHVQGVGLTTAKVASEYVIVVILMIALIVLRAKASLFDRKTRHLVALSIYLTIAAELSFTLYTDLHGFMFALGHFLKLFSYWMIYIVLIDSSLREPFRNLSRHANTYDAVPDEISLVDEQGIILQVNNAISDATGLEKSQCIGQHCHALQHDSSIDIADCVICSAIAAGENLKSAEFFNCDNRQWYEVSLSDIRHGGQLAGLVHVKRNITEVKEAQQRFIGLNKLYKVQSKTNQAATHSISRKQMFDDICQIAVRDGEFKMAWIGLIDQQSIRPESWAGDQQEYLAGIEVRIDQGVLAEGPAGAAVRTLQVSCVNDIETDPSFRPWRDAALDRGYNSMAAVPIFHAGDVIGIAAFYSKMSNAFDENMLALLTTLGNDISSAITRLEEAIKRKKYEQRIQQLSLAVEQSANAIVITDTSFNIEYVNRAFVELTGYEPAEVLQKQPLFLMDEKSQQIMKTEVRRAVTAGIEWTGEMYARRSDGSFFWSEQSIAPLLTDSGEIINYVANFEDVTGLHDAKQTIEKLAFYDPLTNLPNRRLLADRLKQAIEHVDRTPNGMVAVLVFDLDNFKTVNDSLGHNIGDELLKEVAKIFLKQVRKEDTVSRQGGDEFTIILSDMRSIGKIADIADAILKKLKNPIEVSGNQVVIGSSIGIAVYPADAKGYEELIHNADMAMYHAKEEGRNNFQFFTSEMNDKAHQRLLLENKLRGAIENNHFTLYYQPQVDLESGALIGVEALIRWIDPDAGIISPLDFIPLAEETGLIGPIGDWVIRTACHEMANLRDKGFPAIKVAVNVSAYQFRHGEHLTQTIKKNLLSSGLPAEYLALELTESILIDDINETTRLLQRLRGLGITLAIDDFGTGYSSLSYLKQFPIDVLKIDQSFIRDILEDDSDKAIVNAIIALARQLELEVLAEGVETYEHQSYLSSQGCDYVQGYYYCKPIPADEMFDRWQRHKLIVAA